MSKNRVDRLNSLLKEVISEVVIKEVRNPKVAPFVTVTNVEISPDLQHAKVSISVIGSDQQKSDTITALQSAAGFIAIHASKKVVLRYFPALSFKLDTSVDEHLRIDTILNKIHEEQRARKTNDDDNPLSP
ncbi:MAG: 30S ribosome-binding factor RbfA [Simkania sp.]|nr:30S ribosome-binding factor RbfA [Simkania sp.]